MSRCGYRDARTVLVAHWGQRAILSRGLPHDVCVGLRHSGWYRRDNAFNLLRDTRPLNPAKGVDVTSHTAIRPARAHIKHVLDCRDLLRVKISSSLPGAPMMASICGGGHYSFVLL